MKLMGVQRFFYTSLHIFLIKVTFAQVSIPSLVLTSRNVQAKHKIYFSSLSSLIIQITVNSRLFTNCFAESSVKRSVSGVISSCIAPNC